MTEAGGVLLSGEDFEARLRQIGAERYHNLHRFHHRLHSGQCSFTEVQAWALNRYYYQAMIPIKDATVLTRMSEVEDRREWRKRIEDHDGLQPGDGGIERWLKLTDSLGFSRPYVISTQGILPGTRFAVEAYVEFCRSRSLLEAIASSLTELFSPTIISERVAGMLAHYDFVSRETLAYFSQRPVQAKRDSDFALNYVKTHAKTRAEQNLVLAALEFKCSVLWTQLDALWGAYVDGAVPPGAWVAGQGSDKEQAA
ncbi:pyrroloquinoline-quinone synthase PqqC [Beijerinckia indica]|uniref:Pyrroloquinoline-quinone synthase n=1 Tax=Beijerinckia indica subsp. indica (strain ATCC 9039 / DSM 1715 / NCIMB 8712) TaxID=395963 RepID=B2IDU8_BEII9|nr:pyrroloquinoline-quinone synthase PqqC [Beijerinckia indica]ACB96880.1 coenzyme PQQ biosynthesis protein C [Beijerinckia indica subsp. indica ATCC 9039]